MLQSAAVCSTSISTVFEILSTAVVIILQLIPLFLMAVTAKGKSVFTRSGSTCPLGRTVKSIPLKPISAAIAPVS